MSTYYRSAICQYTKSYLLDAMVDGRCTADEIKQLMKSIEFDALLRIIYANLKRGEGGKLEPGIASQAGYMLSEILVRDLVYAYEVDGWKCDDVVFPKLLERLRDSVGIDRWVMMRGSFLEPDEDVAR